MMAKNKPLRSNNKFIHKLTDKGGGGGNKDKNKSIFRKIQI